MEIGWRVVSVRMSLGDIATHKKRGRGLVRFVGMRALRGMNEEKNAKIGEHQRAIGKKFYRAGLLSRQGLEIVLRGKAARYDNLPVGTQAFVGHGQQALSRHAPARTQTG